MSKKLKSLLRTRDNVIEFVLRIEQFLNNTERFDDQQVEIRLEKLEQKWVEFEEVMNDIEAAEDNEENIREQ